MNELTEKFQIVPPPVNDEKEHQWASFNDQRVLANVRDTPDKVEFSEYGGPSHYMLSHNNEMPPGYDIDKQHGNRDKFHAITIAGKTDEENLRERDLNGNVLKEGFFRHNMSPVEDMYTDEHRDDFYDTVVDDKGNEGFVERANYLDRY